MNIKTRPVEYKDGKTKCIGYLAWDDNRADPLPGILINHAWGGLDGFAMDHAVQMAALGYVGFALDNYGDGALPETMEEKAAMMTPLKEDRAALLKRLKAGYKAAASLDEVDETHMAAIGFCFGDFVPWIWRVRVWTFTPRFPFTAYWTHQKACRRRNAKPAFWSVMAGMTPWRHQKLSKHLVKKWPKRIAIGNSTPTAASFTASPTQRRRIRKTASSIMS